MIYIMCITYIFGACKYLYLFMLSYHNSKTHFFQCILDYNIQDVLHNNQNEDNAEDDYEVVDMDDGDHEDKLWLWSGLC